MTRSARLEICALVRGLRKQYQVTILNEAREIELKYPAESSTEGVSFLGRISAVINNTALRPRPVIAPAICVGCGDCALRCPVGAIGVTSDRTFVIDL